MSSIKNFARLALAALALAASLTACTGQPVADPARPARIAAHAVPVEPVSWTAGQCEAYVERIAAYPATEGAVAANAHLTAAAAGIDRCGEVLDAEGLSPLTERIDTASAVIAAHAAERAERDAERAEQRAAARKSKSVKRTYRPSGVSAPAKKMSDFGSYDDLPAQVKRDFEYLTRNGVGTNESRMRAALLENGIDPSR